MLQSLVLSLTRSNTCNKHAGCKRKAIWSKQSAVTLQFFFFEGDPIQPTSNPVATGSCHGCCYYQAGAPPRRTKEFVLANSGCLFLRDLTTCPWRICCHSFESNNIQGGPACSGMLDRDWLRPCRGVTNPHVNWKPVKKLVVLRI